MLDENSRKKNIISLLTSYTLSSTKLRLPSGKAKFHVLHIENYPFIYKKIINSPYFRKSYKLSPIFVQFVCFLPNLCFCFPHILTMMHLCIMLDTYWTPPGGCVCVWVSDIERCTHSLSMSFQFTSSNNIARNCYSWQLTQTRLHLCFVSVYLSICLSICLPACLSICHY